MPATGSKYWCSPAWRASNDARAATASEPTRVAGAMPRVVRMLAHVESDLHRADILGWRSRCNRRLRDYVAAREDVERAL